MRILLDGHKNKRQVHIVLSPHLSTKSVDNSVDVASLIHAKNKYLNSFF